MRLTVALRTPDLIHTTQPNQRPEGRCVLRRNANAIAHRQLMEQLLVGLVTNSHKLDVEFAHILLSFIVEAWRGPSEASIHNLWRESQTIL
jgi:hypothetical protein